MLHILPVLIIFGLAMVFKAVTSQGKKAGNSMKRPVIGNSEIDKPESMDKVDGMHEPDSHPQAVKLRPDRDKWIRMEKQRRGASEENHAIPKQMPSRKTKKKRSGPLQHLTKAKLREGIVLAEILNERPRAKNPHPAAYRYRRTKS